TNALVVQHPDPSELFEAMATDLPGARVVPAGSRAAFPIKRGQDALTLPKDWRLLSGIDLCDAPASRILRSGSFLVEMVAGKLVVRALDGSLQFDMLEIFDTPLSLRVCDCFKLLHPGSHTPRLTIDRLVVCRETWRFDPAEGVFAERKDPLQRY